MTVSSFNEAVIELIGNRVVASTVEVPQHLPANGGLAADALYEFTTSLDLIRVDPQVLTSSHP